ncbi:MAG: hypothetical protein IPI41_15080 [Flavobacteriales bacterium]|nr:hypothetical protein [Flavobacteriales bacterium]
MIAHIATILLMVSSASFSARAQDPAPFQYVARVTPMVPGHSPKPMVGDLIHWLGDPKMHFARMEGLLYLEMHTPLSPEEFRSHVEANGYWVLSLNTGALGQITDRAPHIIHTLDSSDVNSMENATRAKATWIEAHPIQYQEAMRKSTGNAAEHEK